MIAPLMNRPFFAICTVFMAAAFACAQDDGVIDVRRAPNDPTRYLCDIGFATFTTPKGWSPNRSDKPTYAILTHEGETYPQITKMISIDAGKPVSPTSKGMADALAKKWKGKVMGEIIELGGESAYRINCKPNPNRIQPIDCIVVVKDERVLMLIAGAKDLGEIDVALTELAASWKWKKNKKPIDKPNSR